VDSTEENKENVSCANIFQNVEGIPEKITDLTTAEDYQRVQTIPMENDNIFAIVSVSMRFY